ncbi:MAG: nucleotidyl transferase AbiEii/AbiGii toxin family protein [Myxococcales bacterium]|nr:nucleotidyl transferase AbiEii/AbiGii toxin family protein [Myxococcales bacterium]
MGIDRLTTLQRDVLRALADRNCGFFLTGGGVLVGWILGHRTTDDLDLFTAEDEAIAQADALARALAAAVGCRVEPLQTAPDHRRYLFSRGSESTRVDFVRDRGVQLHDKPPRDGVPMDTVEEIIANKITTLASRSEIRDVVDLYYLEQAGHRIEDHLEDARQKDAGATPATIAWVLSTLRVPETIPGEASSQEIAQYVQGLELRMRTASRPDDSQE